MDEKMFQFDEQIERIYKYINSICDGLNVPQRSENISNDIKIGIKNEVKKQLDKSLPNGDLSQKIADLQTQCASLHTRCANLKTQIQENSQNSDTSSFAKEIADLQTQCNTLGGQYTKLNEKVQTILQDTDASSYAKKKEVSTLEDSVESLKEQLNDHVSRQAFGKCVFLCLILLANILTASIIIYCPEYLREIALLPQFWIAPLIALLLLNIVGTCVWLNEYCRSEEDYLGAGNLVFTVLVEIILLILNTVVMWLFTFNPLPEIVDAAIWLIALLVCANVAILMLRVLYFLDEYSSVDATIERSSCALNILGAAFAAGIVIVLIYMKTA